MPRQLAKLPHLLLLCLLLSACDNPKALDDDNFQIAIDKALAQQPILVGYTPLPSEQSPEAMKKQSPPVPLLLTLEKAGLLTSSEVQLGNLYGFTKRNVRVQRFVLTDKGRPFFDEQQSAWRIGTARVSAIKDWYKNENNGPQQVVVSYTWKIDGMPEWTQNPDIRLSFPELAPWIDDQNKAVRQTILKLGMNGWEAME